MTQTSESRQERDDRLLSAWLDDELSAAEADEITDRLAREPALARRLEALRGADPAARAVYEWLDELPMPQGVLDLLEERKRPAASGTPAARERDNVLPFPQRFVQSFWQAPVAVAASLALVAGFLGSRLLIEAPEAGMSALYAQQIPAGSGVHELLENGISTRPATLEDGSEGQLLLTFENNAGDWCRQLAVSRDAVRLQALACRRDGRWQTEALAYGRPAGGDFQPASGNTPTAINAAIDRLIGGEPLGADAEQALVRGGWEKNSPTRE